MVVFEGVVAAIVGVALLAALLQFTGFAPTAAAEARSKVGCHETPPSALRKTPPAAPPA